MLGTLHLRDFGTGAKWYFVSELTCDIGIGYGMVPNDTYIEQNGFEVLNHTDFEFKENMVMEINYRNSYFNYDEQTVKLKLE